MPSPILASTPGNSVHNTVATSRTYSAMAAQEAALDKEAVHDSYTNAVPTQYKYRNVKG